MIMKAQLLPFIFLVILISSVLLGYLFYNAYYGTAYQGNIFEKSVLDALRNELERIKGYSKLSFIYSTHQALREHACLGGLTKATPWICNVPNTVSVEDSKACLEEYTLYYTNTYLENYTILDLPINLAKNNFSSCSYEVDSGGVYSGKYDEGEFWVSINNASMSVFSQYALMKDDMSLNEFITRNRYWYMFRIFTEWAEANVYAPCICSNIGCACSSGSGDQVCTSCASASYQCAQLALKDLQSRFDGTTIRCRVGGTIGVGGSDCCAQGIGPISCVPRNTCIGWSSQVCNADCQHDCVSPPPAGKLCPVKVVSSSSATKTTLYEISSNYNSSVLFDEEGVQTCDRSPITEDLTNELYSVYSENPENFNLLSITRSCFSCSCRYYIEARFASMHTFTCIDSKYYVPSEKGPVPLRFNVAAFASYRAPDLCPVKVRCTGTISEEGTCAECNCPPCPGNVCS